MSLAGLTVLLVAVGVVVVGALIGLVVVLLDRDTEPPPPARKSPTTVRPVIRTNGSPPATARKMPATTSGRIKRISPTTSADTSGLKQAATPTAAATKVTPTKPSVESKSKPTPPTKLSAPGKAMAAKSKTNVSGPHAELRARSSATGGLGGFWRRLSNPWRVAILVAIAAALAITIDVVGRGTPTDSTADFRRGYESGDSGSAATMARNGMSYDAACKTAAIAATADASRGQVPALEDPQAFQSGCLVALRGG